MKRFQVWIDLQDRRYARRLIDFLNMRYGNQMQVFAKGQKEVLPDGQGVLLSDRHTDETSYGRQMLVSALEGVNPYQSGHQIARAILECHEAENQEQPAEEDRRQWVSVYSATGGIGKSTLAMGLAQALAEEERKVLYLSLEGPSAWILYYQYPFAYTVSDLLYCFLMEGAEKGRQQLQKMVYKQSSGVYFLPPCLYPDDLMEFTEEELEAWLSMLKTEFEYVIADMSGQMIRPQRLILEKSTRLCYLLDARAEGEAKWQDFQVRHRQKENAEIFCRYGGRNKLSEILLPEEEQLFEICEGKRQFRKETMYFKCLKQTIAAWS